MQPSPVGGIRIGSGIEESGQDLAIALSGGGVEGRFAPVVYGRGVGSLFQQQHRQIPVSLTTGVVERRVALGIAPVEVDATHEGQLFNKSDLSEETLKWLEWYNSLPPEKQLTVSSIPAELYIDDGAGTVDADQEK